MEASSIPIREACRTFQIQGSCTFSAVFVLKVFAGFWVPGVGFRLGISSVADDLKCLFAKFLQAARVGRQVLPGLGVVCLYKLVLCLKLLSLGLRVWVQDPTKVYRNPYGHFETFYDIPVAQKTYLVKEHRNQKKEPRKSRSLRLQVSELPEVC